MLAMMNNAYLGIGLLVAITNVLAFAIGRDRGLSEMAAYCTKLVEDHNKAQGHGIRCEGTGGGGQGSVHVANGRGV